MGLTPRTQTLLEIANDRDRKDYVIPLTDELIRYVGRRYTTQLASLIGEDAAIKAIDGVEAQLNQGVEDDRVHRAFTEPELLQFLARGVPRELVQSQEWPHDLGAYIGRIAQGSVTRALQLLSLLRAVESPGTYGLSDEEVALLSRIVRKRRSDPHAANEVQALDETLRSGGVTWDDGAQRYVRA